MTDTLGSRFARAIAAKDEPALRALLADDVVQVVFGSWFEESDRVDRVVHVTDGEEVADTALVSYRFDLTNPGGSYVAEQQAYYRGGETIDHLRIMCSGFRPR